MSASPLLSSARSAEHRGDRPVTQTTAYLIGPERLEMREVPVPEPGPGELLLRVGAATTCGTDLKVFQRGGHPRMLKAPTPFGHEMAGTITAVGPTSSGGVGSDGGEIEEWRPGDRVVVANSAPCGVCEWCSRGRENLCSRLQYLNGAFSEYVLVPRRFAEVSTYRLPADLPFEIAALAEPLACVLHGLEISGLERASEVVIYGGGPIGLLFVDVLANSPADFPAAGDHHIVLADPNPWRLEVGRGIGAHATVQVGRDGGEAARLCRRSRTGDGFDVAIEATGSPAAWQDALASVRPGGVVQLFGGCPPGTTVPLDSHRLHYSEITVKSAYHHRPVTFRRALDLLASGALHPRALLSAERPLAELEAALRSMRRREALKVVIRP
ncbi:MAG TPA: alcohol dehydrogenase catalytic domain-containing protein [Thermoanaerobaculia bacterium]|jgi:L-iditol 2-dehydrogenase|nr:alcohol dehydrogenase catalytic domain-containing protein [Thermoanaerobaculia bacterium]